MEQMSPSAITHNTNMLEVQQKVFEKEIEQKHIENIFAFIVSNGALFRYFAEHLPDNLYKVWDEAASEEENKKAIEELGGHYDSFRKDIMSELEELDPEVITALTEDAENGDIDGASKILETYFALKEEAREEMLM